MNSLCALMSAVLCECVVQKSNYVGCVFGCMLAISNDFSYSFFFITNTGLAFDSWDLDYYTSMFQRIKRNPTSVECFDLAQSNRWRHSASKHVLVHLFFFPSL